MRNFEVTGYLAADAEKKISKNGKEFISFSLANHEFDDEKTPDGRTKTFWVRVTCFNQRFFGMAQHLTKGKYVQVHGDYSDKIYQTKEGNCEISRDILANAIYFINSSKSEDTSTTKQNTTETPVVQTKMEETPKPTTAELKIPSPPKVDDEDDLPF